MTSGCAGVRSGQEAVCAGGPVRLASPPRRLKPREQVRRGASGVTERWQSQPGLERREQRVVIRALGNPGVSPRSRTRDDQGDATAAGAGAPARLVP